MEDRKSSIEVGERVCFNRGWLEHMRSRTRHGKTYVVELVGVSWQGEAWALELRELSKEEARKRVKVIDVGKAPGAARVPGLTAGDAKELGLAGAAKLIGPAGEKYPETEE